ncbi:hypothetical protein GF352_00310 [archaeon]|nr:hypothetical protein [archaeon]
MKTLLLIITLFVIALIFSPLVSSVNGRVVFNYNITGCAETINGTTTRSRMPDNTSPSITVKNGVLEYYRATSHLCARKAVVEHEINKSIITLYEVWTGLGARCICFSEINASIKGLTNGNYLVNVYETGVKPGSNESMTPRLLVTETINIS